jgi:DNA polymerase-3 subunit epsilon
VIDIETTGLDTERDEVVSVGIIPISRGRIHASRSLYIVCNPVGSVGSEAMKVHSLRRADLAAAPRIEERLGEVVAAISGRTIVAHGAWVEAAFLDRLLEPVRLALPRPIIDTAVLARHCLPARLSAAGRLISLEDASDALGLPVHTPHHALGDAMTTAQIFLALGSRLSADRPLTVSGLARLSRP